MSKARSCEDPVNTTRVSWHRKGIMYLHQKLRSNWLNYNKLLWSSGRMLSHCSVYMMHLQAKCRTFDFHHFSQEYWSNRLVQCGIFLFGVRSDNLKSVRVCTAVIGLNGTGIVLVPFSKVAFKTSMNSRSSWYSSKRGPRRLHFCNEFLNNTENLFKRQSLQGLQTRKIWCNNSSVW